MAFSQRLYTYRPMEPPPGARQLRSDLSPARVGARFIAPVVQHIPLLLRRQKPTSFVSASKAAWFGTYAIDAAVGKSHETRNQTMCFSFVGDMHEEDFTTRDEKAHLLPEPAK